MVPALPLPGTRRRDPFWAPGGNPHFDELLVGDSAIAVAGRAGVFDAALAVAARAGQVELHVARHLRHAAGAAALRTAHGAGFIASGAVTDRALLVAGDFDLFLSTPDRLPEGDVEAVFEVGAFFGHGFGLLASGGIATEELAEDVLEGATTAPDCRGLERLPRSASACASRNISEKSNPPKSMFGPPRCAPAPAAPAPPPAAKPASE